MSDDDFVYGYGRTKHIRDRTAIFSGDWGLCGAAGGYPMRAPDRLICKRCERKAAARGQVVTPATPEDPNGDER